MYLILSNNTTIFNNKWVNPIFLEIACLVILVMLAIVFFSAQKMKNNSKILFIILVCTSFFNFVFDIFSLYLINNVSLTNEANDIAQRIYAFFIVLSIYIAFVNVINLVENSKAKHIINLIGMFAFVIYVVIVSVVEISYEATEYGNFVKGAIPVLTFSFIAFYVVFMMVMMLVKGKSLNLVKKRYIFYAALVELIISFVQMRYEVYFLTSLGLLLMNLAIYFTLDKSEEVDQKMSDDTSQIFLTNMSHELRTPMNSIVGNVDILQKTTLDEKQLECIRMIRSSGDSLMTMIEDILDMTRLEKNTFKLVDTQYEINTMLSELKAMLKQSFGNKGNKLKISVDKSIPSSLFGDKQRIKQVLVYFIGLSNRFSENETVSLEVNLLERDNAVVKIEFTIKDNGMGMDKAAKDQLSDVFAEKEFFVEDISDNIAVKMGNCNKIINLMGGEISYNSEYGQGTTISFSITQRISDIKNVKKYRAPAARILIVDDNEMNLKVAAGILKPLDIIPDKATSGKDAIYLANRANYDIIFMDHLMPEMDGIETIEVIRKINSYYANAPIVAFTANSEQEAKEIFAKVNVTDIIVKPIDTSIMYSTIAKLLDNRLVIVEEENYENITVVEKSSSDEYNKNDNHKNDNDKKDNLTGTSGDSQSGKDDNDPIYDIEGIDVQAGIKNAGSLDMLKQIMGDYYKVIDIKANKIKQCLDDGLIKDYTIEVHGLKSTSRIIGAMDLGEKFYELEMLGKEEKIDEIMAKNSGVLDEYRGFKEKLKPYGMVDDSTKSETTAENLIKILNTIKESIDLFDLDKTDEAMAELEQYKLNSQCNDLMEELRAYVADVAMEDIISTADKMIAILTDEGM